MKTQPTKITFAQLVKELSTMLMDDDEIKSINLDGRIDPSKIEINVEDDDSMTIH
jgi:hypothetical protein